MHADLGFKVAMAWMLALIESMVSVMTTFDRYENSLEELHRLLQRK